VGSSRSKQIRDFLFFFNRQGLANQICVQFEIPGPTLHNRRNPRASQPAGRLSLAAHSSLVA
jgi:hypothetical protein